MQRGETCSRREPGGIRYNQNSEHAEKIRHLQLSKSSALKTQRAKRDRERSSPRPRKTPTIKILTSGKLSEIALAAARLQHAAGRSEQEYGGRQLNLGLTPEDSPKNVERNQARFAAQAEGTGCRGKAVAAGSAEPGTLGGDPPGLWRAWAGVGAAAQGQRRGNRRRRADHQHAQECCWESRSPTASR